MKVKIDGINLETRDIAVIGNILTDCVGNPYFVLYMSCKTNFRFERELDKMKMHSGQPTDKSSKAKAAYEDVKDLRDRIEKIWLSGDEIEVIDFTQR